MNLKVTRLSLKTSLPVTLILALIVGFITLVPYRSAGRGSGRYYDFPQGLRVSANGRYLVNNDSPFLWVADTAWMIFAGTREADAEFYLNQRKQSGFNVIQAYVLPWNPFTTANRYGEKPFLDTPWEPNPYYFGYVDRLITMANDLGFVMAINPAELDSLEQCTTVDDIQEHLPAFAAWLAERYKNYNIVWVLGGDKSPVNPVDVSAVVQAEAQAILSHDPNHLITYHPRSDKGQNSSSVFFQNESWLNFNMMQVSNIDDDSAYRVAYNDYTKTPVKPTLLAETEYENAGETWEDGRLQSYGAFLAGGYVGITYGQVGPMNMLDATVDWKAKLVSPVAVGAKEMGYFRQLFGSRAYFLLVPDSAHTVITAASTVGFTGFGEFNEWGNNGAPVTAAASDRSFSVTYIPAAYDPPTGTRAYLTVNMSKFPGPVTAKWFDPTDGTYQIISGSPFTNYGSQTFRAPNATNHDDKRDRLLVLETLNETPVPIERRLKRRPEFAKCFGANGQSAFAADELPNFLRWGRGMSFDEFGRINFKSYQ